MALEVQRKQAEIKRPDPKEDASAPSDATKTPTSGAAAPAPSPTPTSSTPDTQRAQPTLQTSLDSRRRFRAESGTAQVAVNVNRELDGATDPANAQPANAQTATRARALRLVENVGPTETTATQVKTGEEAIAVLDRDFDAFDTANQGGSTDGNVSEDDLRAVADNKGERFTEEQRSAAQFLLDSQTYRSFLDVGAGRGNVDGNISREDVNGAKATMQSGTYQDELLDTAAGRGGRDGYVSNDDVAAALSDPGVSQETKDAINLTLLSSDGSSNLHSALGGLTTSEIADASKLTRSPAFTAMSGTDKRLAADAFRDSGGDSAVTSEIKTLIEGKGSAEQKTAGLNRIALLNSPELRALPTSDQDLVRQTLSNAEPGDLPVAANLKSLLEDPKFNELEAAEKTAILSQARNYPDSRSVENLEKMVNKDWFQDQSLEDKQRSAKLVAYLAQDESGDRTITENTLNRLVSPDSNDKLEWEAIAADANNNITLGYASGDTLTLNSNLVAAGNNPVAADELGVIEGTTAHEISHLVNGDRTNQTFEYLNEEYRAWYVGYQAEHGRPPSNQEAMDRWEYFLNPDGGYADYSHGTEGGWFGIGAKDGALEKPEEAAQIYNLLSELSGVEVTADNYQAVMADPSSWKTNPNDPASDDVFPATDDLDN